MSTFLKLKENEREVRRELIIHAALELFEEKSFHEIGMRDIANKAGVSPASIYRYFPSQDGLFVETLTHTISEIEKSFKQQIEEGQTSIQELAIGVIDYLVDNEATFQMMCHFMVKGEINPDTLDKYNLVQRYLFNLFDNVLMSNGETDNIRLVSHAFFASLVGIVMSFRNYPGRSKNEIRKHMHRLALLLADTFQNNINQGFPKEKSYQSAVTH